MSKGGGSNATKLGDWSSGLEGPWTGLINRAIEHSEQPYQSFFGATGQTRTPGINADQNEAMNYTRNMARMSSSPIGAMDGARAGIEDTLGGQYLGQSPGAEGGNTGDPWSYLTNNYRDRQNPYAQSGAEVQQNYMNWQAYQNPYSDRANDFTGLSDKQNPYSGQQINTGGMFSAAPTQAGTNAFQGMENPYFRQSMQQGMQDIGDVYKNVTEPELRAQMVLNGTSGGGVEQQLRDRNQGNLAKQLTQYATGMQNQQYDRSAGLDESRLGRAFQGQQFDTSTGAQSFENAAQRGMQGQQFGMGLGSQNYENALNRAFQGQEAQYGRGYGSNEADAARRYGGEEARIDRILQNGQFNKELGGTWAENQLNRGFQSDESALTRGEAGWQRGQDRAMGAYDAERNRMMQGVGLGQNEQNLAYQRIASMMGIGDFQRGVQGQQTDEAYQNWFNERNYNQNADSWLAGILSGAQGGLPASQMTPGASPWANAIGTGLAAYGMFR